MKVYLTGDREKSVPEHTLYVCPAGDKRLSPVNVPHQWLDEEKKPLTFPIIFRYGKADVEETLGRYLVDTEVCSVSSLLKPRGRSILGALALRTTPPTQF